MRLNGRDVRSEVAKDQSLKFDEEKWRGHEKRSGGYAIKESEGGARELF